MDAVFFEQLSLPAPDHNLAVGSDSHGRQTGKMIAEIDSLIETEEPDYVLVQGDTNSTLAGSIAASKRESVLCHVEAGLRSYDRTMPEETNRVLADHAADLLFPPTERSQENLLEEDIERERTTVTGNTVVDAIEQNITFAPTPESLLHDADLTTADGSYLLLTLHRAENVDDPARFQHLIEVVGSIADEFSLTCVYPIHPRSMERVEEFDLDVPASIKLVEPFDYLDFLTLEDCARLILTDSGGVQEEACTLGTPCLTLRGNTERPETVEVGSNRIVGTDAEAIRAGSRQMIDADPTWENPFGDGRSAVRIVDQILDDWGGE
jgi:UDP-N-acetylglucosamine 2-epimerase (non-hydrolysing)